MPEQTQEIFTDQIMLPKDNMRKHVDRDEIYDLAEDIKKNGLISPILIRPKDGKFELVAGQRRYLAHQVAGILKIKCIVRELSDEEAFAIMTSENLARVDVNPIDEANHVIRLLEMKGNDIKAVCHIVGRSEQWVNDRVEIGNMPDYLQEFLANGEIKLGVALALNQITNERIKRLWVNDAVRNGISVATAQYQLNDYRVNKEMYDGVVNETSDADATIAPKPIMIVCAITGKEYDPRVCKAVMIAEENLPLFGEFVRLYRLESAKSEPAPVAG